MKDLKKLTFFFTVLVIAFTPLDALEISEGSNTTLGRYLFVAMAGCALFSKDLFIRQNIKIFTILIGFIIWAFLTIFWSVDPEISFGRVLLLFQYAIIFMVMVNVLNTQKRLKWAMIGWILGATYIAYKTATDFSTNATADSQLYRVDDFGNPNENSFMLCYGLIFCYLLDKTKYKIPSLVFTAFSAYPIVANGSRMGVILFAFAVMAFCLQLWKDNKKGYVYMIVPCLILGGIYILSHVPAATLMRLLGIAENIEEGNLANRQSIWGAASEMLTDNLGYYIYGCGWGAFPVAINKYLGKFIGAHNFYLDLLCTTGVVGFSLVMYYLLRLYRIIKNTFKANIINYLFLFLPMISMLSTNWQSRRWWFLMGAFIYLIYKTGNFQTQNELNGRKEE